VHLHVDSAEKRRYSFSLYLARNNIDSLNHRFDARSRKVQVAATVPADGWCVHLVLLSRGHSQNVHLHVDPAEKRRYSFSLYLARNNIDSLNHRFDARSRKVQVAATVPADCWCVHLVLLSRGHSQPYRNVHLHVDPAEKRRYSFSLYLARNNIDSLNHRFDAQSRKPLKVQVAATVPADGWCVLLSRGHSQP
jgi:hypothetical protein